MNIHYTTHTMDCNELYQVLINNDWEKLIEIIEDSPDVTGKEDALALIRIENPLSVLNGILSLCSQIDKDHHTEFSVNLAMAGHNYALKIYDTYVEQYSFFNEITNNLMLLVTEVLIHFGKAEKALQYANRCLMHETVIKSEEIKNSILLLKTDAMVHLGLFDLADRTLDHVSIVRLKNEDSGKYTALKKKIKEHMDKTGEE